MLIRNEIELNQSNTHKMKEKMAKLHTRSVTVGVHRKDNRPYPDRPDVKPATVGMFHEFGTSNLPPRMWLRIFKLITQEKTKLWDKINESIKKHDNAVLILRAIGIYQKERVVDRILKNGVTPASNSPITLVDTGHLVNSIDYEVH